jgi:type I restriction enzyme S subunit
MTTMAGADLNSRLAASPAKAEGRESPRHLPRYAQYRESGVAWLGELPAHWGARPIKALASLNDDALPETTPPDFELSYVDIGSVSLDAGIERTEDFIFAAAPSRARRLVRDGDVIVSTVRTYLKAIAPIVCPPGNLVVSTGFAVVRPGSMLDSDFAKYALQSEKFVDQVISRSTGVSYPAINASDLARIELPSPPRDEQSAIATFLDRETGKIDALIAEQEKLLTLLAEKRQATISHAVTRGLNPNAPMKDSGVPWLGEVPAHWAVLKIRWIVRSIEQGWSPQCENYPVEDPSEWGVLKVGCVNGGVFNALENKKLPDDLQPFPDYALKKGDLLISRANTRDLVGGAAVVPDDHAKLLLCDKLYRLRVNLEEYDPRFIAAFMVTEKARSQIELQATGPAALCLTSVSR